MTKLLFDIIFKEANESWCRERRSSVLVSVLNSGREVQVWRKTWWGHCVVFFGKTVHSHNASQEYKLVLEKLHQANLVRLP